LKIGYTSYSEDYSTPSDRRRFMGYAKHRNLTVEKADLSKDYDIVLLTYFGDVNGWIEKKKQNPSKFKLIFELQDSYLVESPSFRTVFRGAGKYLTGASRKFYWDYKDMLIEVFGVADAIICTTLENKDLILAYNKNVHVCLDYFEDEIQALKSDYTNKGEKLKIVWEGQAYTLHNLLAIKDALEELKDEMELHIITDLVYYKYAKKYGKTDSRNIIKSINCDKYFYSWEKANFNQQIIESDLAIIPINRKDGLQKGKPENKLILFWLMAMPVLTTSTPAYQRIMEKSGVNLHLDTTEDWIKAIRDYKNKGSQDRASLGSQCFDFAKQHYTKEQIGGMWDKVFESVYTPQYKA
jgi:glycosyltransferase involved in cell wall biosynthesis